MIPTSSFDRFTRVSELGDVMQRMLRPGVAVIAVITALMCARLFFKDESGWMGLLFMGAGACIACAIWRSSGIGLPLLPMMAIQHLAVYGIPIFSRNETVVVYPDAMITQSGVQIFTFLVAMSFAWRGGMNLFTPKRTMAYTFKIFATGGSRTLQNVALGLIIATTAHEVLSSLGVMSSVYSVLPNGSYSLVYAAVNAMSMSGFFFAAMCIGAGNVASAFRLIFWAAFVISCTLLAASFLLSATTNLVGAVGIGLFWGAGRVPWRFMVITISILSFFHIGKFEMRERYWQMGDEVAAQHVSLSQIVPHYAEWIDSSYSIITGQAEDRGRKPRRDDGEKKNHSMLNRVNNLQNLLFAIDAVENQSITPLNGKTYTIIPPLLIPRILWPDKPRTHEGQVLLNTHFGRQSLRDSFTTYIAWGLVPEAYGNFGAFWGVIILGAGCGLIFAWLEVSTVYKPLLSMEGLIAFALFIGLALSFEMVASVLITSLFQSVVTIALACIPLVEHTLPEDPESEDSEESTEETPA